MATTKDPIATDSAAELHDLIGDDATATFESDPKFIESNPTGGASSENIEVQRDTDDAAESDGELEDADTNEGGVDDETGNETADPTDDGVDEDTHGGEEGEVDTEGGEEDTEGGEVGGEVDEEEDTKAEANYQRT